MTLAEMYFEHNLAVYRARWAARARLCAVCGQTRGGETNTPVHVGVCKRKTCRRVWRSWGSAGSSPKVSSPAVTAPRAGQGKPACGAA